MSHLDTAFLLGSHVAREAFTKTATGGSTTVELGASALQALKARLLTGAVTGAAGAGVGGLTGDSAIEGDYLGNLTDGRLGQKAEEGTRGRNALVGGLLGAGAGFMGTPALQRLYMKFHPKVVNAEKAMAGTLSESGKAKLKGGAEQIAPMPWIPQIPGKEELRTLVPQALRKPRVQ